jgi:hypothetical protein
MMRVAMGPRTTAAALPPWTNQEKRKFGVNKRKKHTPTQIKIIPSVPILVRQILG